MKNKYLLNPGIWELRIILIIFLKQQPSIFGPKLSEFKGKCCPDFFSFFPHPLNLCVGEFGATRYLPSAGVQLRGESTSLLRGDVRGHAGVPCALPLLIGVISLAWEAPLLSWRCSFGQLIHYRTCATTSFIIPCFDLQCRGFGSWGSLWLQLQAMLVRKGRSAGAQAAWQLCSAWPRGGPTATRGAASHQGCPMQHKPVGRWHRSSGWEGFQVLI